MNASGRTVEKDHALEAVRESASLGNDLLAEFHFRSRLSFDLLFLFLPGVNRRLVRILGDR